MKIDDIIPKKKYFLKRTHQNESRTHRCDEYISIFVLETDTKKSQVLASLGGAPAKWFTSHSYSRWVKSAPADAGMYRLVAPKMGR